MKRSAEQDYKVDRFKIVGVAQKGKKYEWLLRSHHSKPSNDLFYIPMVSNAKDTFEHANKLYGKYLIVEYVTLDKNGFPLEARGVRVYE